MRIFFSVQKFSCGVFIALFLIFNIFLGRNVTLYSPACMYMFFLVHWFIQINITSIMVAVTLFPSAGTIRSKSVTFFGVVVG